MSIMRILNTRINTQCKDNALNINVSRCRCVDSTPLWNWLFELYLWVEFKCPFNKYKGTHQHEVYDHLGVIDTLGWSRSETLFTWSYSDELTSLFGIKLLWGRLMVYLWN